MLIRTGFDIALSAYQPTAVVVMLSIVPDREKDLRTPQIITADPEVPLHHYHDRFGNVCTRLTLPAGEAVTLSADYVVEDSGLHDVVARDAIQHPIEELPDEALLFLLGSRYCEVGKLTYEAWNAANPFETGWDKVQALVALAHERIEFGYRHARSDRTAWDAYGERLGVCRDFAHLAVTLCREVNIPARYCTGYLGDLGIDPIDEPMDFSAWFEAYVGGRWYTFDARHNKRRIGRIVMARGRDAADTAIATTFGPHQLLRFDVHTVEVADTDLSRPPQEAAVPQHAISPP